MNRSIGAELCFVAIVCIGMAAQTEPVLTTVNVPKYPPLARQARVEGIVKLVFTLWANAGEPTNVEVVSGHPLLKAVAMENVKTWKFDNSAAVERKYEITFKYRLSGIEVAGRGRESVTFESFHYVEVLTDPPELSVNY
jgi:TonB family protein